MSAVLIRMRPDDTQGLDDRLWAEGLRVKAVDASLKGQPAWRTHGGNSNAGIAHTHGHTGRRTRPFKAKTAIGLWRAYSLGGQTHPRYGGLWPRALCSVWLAQAHGLGRAHESRCAVYGLWL